MEATLLSENNVIVTATRVIAGGQTYAVSAITSVRILTEAGPVAGPVILFVLAALTLSGAISASSWTAGIVGLAFGGAGYLATKASKPTHILVLRTSAGESRAVFSQDRAFVQRVHDAITSAIVARG